MNSQLLGTAAFLSTIVEMEKSCTRRKLAGQRPNRISLGASTRISVLGEKIVLRRSPVLGSSDYESATL